MQFVDFAEDNGVAIITLNRPEKLNALNRPMAAQLNAAFRKFFSSSDYRVAIYRAAGRAFSAGVDMVDMQAATAGGSISGAGGAFDIEFEDAEFCEKPIIAAIQGQCFGFGFTTSLACDFRFAADNSIFCLPEVKFGVASVHGNMRLVRMAGLVPSLELLLTGEPREAQWALNAGIINEVVPLDQLHQRSLACARLVASMEPDVVLASRKVAYLAQYSSFTDTVAAGLSMRANLKVNAAYVDQITGRSSARAAGGM